MKTNLFFFWCLLGLLVFSCSEDDTPIIDTPVDPVPADSLYFPPIDQSSWETVDPIDLGWDTDEVQALIDYVSSKNSKSLMILHEGRIVVEEYFDGHTADTEWQWFSTVKSLTSVGVGIAQDEGLLSIEDKTSDYLGEDWSSLEQEKQDLIKVKHHITMTTGLQSPIGQLIQWTCIAPACMQYEVDAGTQWAYHQGAFTQTQEILSSAAGQNYQAYLKEKIGDKIGLSGSWSSLLDVRIFSSKARGMARFGLLALNEGDWDGEQIYPKDYHHQMIVASQEHNRAYGYLWWLNSGEDFLVTNDQSLFSGPLVPNAPSDMYAALGANDQKIYIVPSLDLVVVRQGDSAGNSAFASSSFDNEFWEKINAILP